MRRFGTKKDYTIKKGTFIPQSVRVRQVKKQKKLPSFRVNFLRLPPRPAYMLLPAALTVFIVGFFAVQSLPAQSLPATPIVVITTDAPYTHTALSFGSNTSLDDQTVFLKAKNAFISNHTSFLVIDNSDKKIELYKEGVLIFSTHIQQNPIENSWFDAKSGLYRVTDVSEQIYDAVNRAYYSSAVKFASNYIIHGNVEAANGEVIDTPARSGIKVSEMAAVDLASLVVKDWPVLVHTPKVEEASSFAYRINGPYVPARSYIAADVETGDILFQNNQAAAFPIASLTKLMTAVIATEYFEVSSRIAITQEQYVTTLVPRLEGRREANLFSLLQLLMVESSNEAAEVLAAHEGRDTFIALMNEKAAELGMDDTTFTDPSGLNNDNVSSAQDLLTLVRYISERHPFLWSVSMGEVEEFTPAEEFVNLDNFNEVKDIDNVIGGKIGETEAARQTSVSLHTHTVAGVERTIAVIILGTESRTQSVRAVDNFISRQYAED